MPNSRNKLSSDASTLKRGSVTRPKAAALGVAIAVSGSFAGWNYGLAAGGWGGMLVAVLATGLLFFCLTQAVAELSAAMPESAGFDAYVGMALGPVAGFLAGICVALGLAVGTGLALSSPLPIRRGCSGVGGWAIKGSLLVIVLLLHLRGARGGHRPHDGGGRNRGCGVAVLLSCDGAARQPIKSVCRGVGPADAFRCRCARHHSVRPFCALHVARSGAGGSGCRGSQRPSQRDAASTARCHSDDLRYRCCGAVHCYRCDRCGSVERCR